MLQLLGAVTVCVTVYVPIAVNSIVGLALLADEPPVKLQPVAGATTQFSVAPAATVGAEVFVNATGYLPEVFKQPTL